VRILVLLICFLVSLNSVSAKKKRVLSFSGKGISDVSSLVIPNRIRFLFFTSNSIVDVSELSLPNKLKSLSLSDNLITDISNLSLPDSLARLSLGGNTITDFSVLKEHPGLSFLDIGEMNLDSSFDFDVLPTNITFLSITSNNFVSLDLAKYTNLTDLNISSNESLDYSQTLFPTSLTYIGMGNVVAPDDFTGLVLPEGLEEISLAGSFMSQDELKTLVIPPNLREIDLRFNLLANVDDIEFPDSLRKLNLKKNQFTKAEKKKIRKRFRGTRVKVKL
jgi:hypothetical protein